MAQFPIQSTTGDPIFRTQNNSISAVRNFSRIAADAGIKLNNQERIVSPGDDALSFSTSRLIRTEVSALKVVQETGQLNITGLNIAMEGLNNIKQQLDGVKKALVQSQVADASEVPGIQAEIDLALAQIDSTAKNTKLGARSLLNGESTIRGYESINAGGIISDFSRYANGESLTTSSGVQGVTVNKIGVGGATRLLDDGRSVLSLQVSLLSTNVADKAFVSISSAPGAGEFVELRVTGKLGSATIRLESDQLDSLADPGGAVDAFNSLAEETGVVLTSGTDLGFSTVGYGSDEFIKVELVAKSSGGSITLGGSAMSAVGAAKTEYGNAATALVNGYEVELTGEYGTTARFLNNGFDIELDFSTTGLGFTSSGLSASNITSTVNIDLTQGVTGLLGTTGSAGDMMQYSFGNFTTESLGRGNAQYTMVNVSGGALISALDVDGNKVINQASVAELSSSGNLALDSGNIMDALKTIDRAVMQVVKEQTRLGTIQGNFIDAVSRAEVGIGNLSAADADIIGVDAATEITNLVQAQLGVSTASSVLGQANNIQQTIFSLLR